MLDLRTLALINTLSALVFFFASFTVWCLDRRQRGVRDWTVAAALHAASTFLFALRGNIPDFFSIIVGNAALLLALALMYSGTRALFHAGGRRTWHWLTAGAAIAGCIVFTYALPSVQARITVVSGACVPVFLACARYFLTSREPRLRAVDRLTALIFGIGAALLLVRALVAREAAVSQDYTTTPNWVVAAPYFYAILFNVWIAIMVTLKISARLHIQLSQALDSAEASNRRLAETLEFDEAILVNSPLPMGVYDADGRCVRANEAYAELVGTRRDNLLQQNFRTIPSWQRAGLSEDCAVALAQNRPQRREIHVISSFGKELWVECRILPTRLAGQPHLLIQFFDLTERKRMEQTLQYAAFHDALTLLPNRRLLLDRLGHALRAGKRGNHHLAVLLLDLNRFKALNDEHGHVAGDKMLIETAARLRRCVRKSDTVARLGGDEFVVLLERLGPSREKAQEYANAVAAKIDRALREEFQLGELRYRGSASIGIRLILDEDADIDLVLRDADNAMYQAKRCAA
jgi:diguanylate cyclase (GGDEF)-like protein/PAS domain S-box-containing protein